jgi:hypothetical protein
MRKLAIILTFLLTLVGGTVPAASAQNVWNNLGGDPVALNRPDADKRFPEFLKLSTIPEHIKARFLEEMQRDPEGKTVYLNPGDGLKEMAFGQKRMRIWKDVVVGTMRLERGVVKAVEAREWRVEDGDRVYVLVMPLICYNWAWRVETPPRPREVPPPPEECAELFVPVVPGDKLTITYLPKGYLPPRSACFGFKQGDGSITVQPCLTCFDVTTHGVTVLFSLEAIKHDIGVCVERNGEKTCMMIVNPTDWKLNKFSLDLQYWRWERDKCPTGRPEDLK